LGQTLEMAHEVIGADADQATAEWQVGHDRGQPGCLRQRLSQRIQQFVAALGPGTLPGASPQALGIQPELEGLAETQEGVARQMHAAFDALQQIARLERCQLEPRGYGRIQVCRYVKW
jgi:hypothetical protein